MTQLHPRASAGAPVRRLGARRAIVVACTGLALAAFAALGPGSADAQAAIPTMTRAEIIARAESGLGTDYTWGGESWTPDARSGTGPDCSGYGLKCWEVPKTLLYQE